MQITHHEARKLIHLASDAALNAHQRLVLDSHVASCLECQEYARSIRQMESLLRPLLQRQWNQQPIPLSMSELTSASYPKVSGSMILATRIAAIGVMFMVFLFSAWQFTFSVPQAPRTEAANVPLIPIPSTSTHTQLVSTTTQTQPCEETTYTVQQNDTLESIGARFRVSSQDLMQANLLTSPVLTAGLELTIPSCHFTPTVHTLTTTLTPILSPITSTPGG